MRPVNTPVLAGMGRTAAPVTRRRWLRWAAWLTAMLAFLAYPIGELVSRDLPAGLLAFGCASLAVFAGLWWRTMWLALATTEGVRAALPWLAAATLLGVGLAFGFDGQQFSGLFIYLSIAGAVSLSLPAAVGWIVAATGAAAVLLFVRLPEAPSGGVVLSELSFVFWLGAMMLFFRRTMLLILELRRAREDLARLAVAEERVRFARDLHDLLGHSLSVISLKAQLAARLVGRDDGRVATEVADIGAVAAGALSEVREAVTGYRRRTLADELDAARSALAAADVALHAELPAASLPAGADELLGWVVREAATNVIRHRHARHCSITISRDTGSARADVRDDGTAVTAPRPRDGNGLAGLAQRLDHAGGHLVAGPAGGGGFRVTATVPLHESATSP